MARLLDLGEMEQRFSGEITSALPGDVHGIEGKLGDHLEQFCDLMAGIALYGSVDPMESGWLPEFIRTAGLNARKKWSSALRRGLAGFPPGSGARSGPAGSRATGSFAFHLSSAGPRGGCPDG